MANQIIPPSRKKQHAATKLLMSPFLRPGAEPGGGLPSNTDATGRQALEKGGAVSPFAKTLTTFPTSIGSGGVDPPFPTSGITKSGKKSVAKPRPKFRVPEWGIGPIPVGEENHNDVLRGRGGQVNAHPGNIQLREMVAPRKKEYLEKDKLQKAHFAMEIIECIRGMNPPGRFLELREGNWWDIGDKKAIKKVAQAFRDVKVSDEGQGDDQDDESDNDSKNNNVTDKGNKSDAVSKERMNQNINHGGVYEPPNNKNNRGHLVQNPPGETYGHVFPESVSTAPPVSQQQQRESATTSSPLPFVAAQNSQVLSSNTTRNNSPSSALPIAEMQICPPPTYQGQSQNFSYMNQQHPQYFNLQQQQQLQQQQGLGGAIVSRMVASPTTFNRKTAFVKASSLGIDNPPMAKPPDANDSNKNFNSVGKTFFGVRGMNVNKASVSAAVKQAMMTNYNQHQPSQFTTETIFGRCVNIPAEKESSVLSGVSNMSALTEFSGLGSDCNDQFNFSSAAASSTANRDHSTNDSSNMYSMNGLSSQPRFDPSMFRGSTLTNVTSSVNAAIISESAAGLGDSMNAENMKKAIEASNRERDLRMSSITMSGSFNMASTTQLKFSDGDSTYDPLMSWTTGPSGLAVLGNTNASSSHHASSSTNLTSSDGHLNRVHTATRDDSFQYSHSRSHQRMMIPNVRSYQQPQLSGIYEQHPMQFEAQRQYYGTHAQQYPPQQQTQPQHHDWYKPKHMFPSSDDSIGSVSDFGGMKDDMTLLSLDPSLDDGRPTSHRNPLWVNGGDEGSIQENNSFRSGPLLRSGQTTNSSSRKLLNNNFTSTASVTDMSINSGLGSIANQSFASFSVMSELSHNLNALDLASSRSTTSMNYQHFQPPPLHINQSSRPSVSEQSNQHFKHEQQESQFVTKFSENIDNYEGRTHFHDGLFPYQRSGYVGAGGTDGQSGSSAATYQHNESMAEMKMNRYTNDASMNVNGLDDVQESSRSVDSIDLSTVVKIYEGREMLEM